MPRESGLGGGGNLRSILRFRALATLAGLALTVLFSGIDIPFRCPAILYAWTALLAALPTLCLASERRGSDVLPAAPAAEAALPGRTEP